MRYPTVPERKTSRTMVDTFRGYNHNLRIGQGEFFDMKNMTSDHYPVLSPRKKRGFYVKPASPQALIAKDTVCYVDGSEFVIGDTRIDMGLSVDMADCPKQLVSMGAYVIIMPDKKYINTIDTEDRGSIEAEFASSEDVTFTMCNISGEAYENVTVSPEAPAEPENLAYWIDTSGSPHRLKQYAATTGTWVTVLTTYVKISSPGLGSVFTQYDGVTIDGITVDSLQDLNATMVVQALGEDYIVVVGILDEVATQAGGITIRRSMPNMDYLVESNNRLWGCRYGTSLKGDIVNEIYCCKLGDFKNWNCFMGLATDSYVASCGTDGPFTGAVAPQGRPIFWKEKFFHEVYGTIPANFQIQDTACRGVQQGCHMSLAIVNEVLFYKSRFGICAFDGSMPEDASYALANQNYSDAIGAAHNNKYYVSMKDEYGEWHLFVYDVSRKMWHKEDDLHALCFCSHQGELYCIDAETNNIITLHGSGTEMEEQVEWMVETGELGLSSPDMKYVSNLNIRMTLDVGSEMNIYVQYDLSDEWLHICNIKSTRLRSFSVPIRPRRCDHMKLRIEAKGPGKVYSYTKTYAQGSDRS